MLSMSVSLFVSLLVHLHLSCVQKLRPVHLLPCDFTLVDLMAALNTGIATMSTTAQLSI